MIEINDNIETFEINPNLETFKLKILINKVK